MTDQIAPSLATELEQIEGYFVSVGSYVRPVSNSKDWLLANGGSKGDKFYRADDVDALLTRASALARAAENSAQAEPLYIDWKRQGYACVVCGAFKLDTCDVAHAADCSWAILRALVSSEGPHEPKQADEIPVGSRWQDNDDPRIAPRAVPESIHAGRKGRPVAMTEQTRRDRHANGRYTDTNLSKPCACGHALGDHASAPEPGDADERPCLYGRIGADGEAPACNCKHFTPVRTA